MSTIQELRDARLEKLDKIKKLGINPYPAMAQRTHTCALISAQFSKLQDEQVTVVGRITALREHGKLVFIDVTDASGTVQIYIQQEKLQEKTDETTQTLGFGDLALLNTGDFIQVSGTVTKTKAGEVSVQPGHVKILSKSLRPVPEDIKNVEEKYRKRYLDLLVNTEAKDVLDARWNIEKEIRKFLWNEGFDEVETPILQSLYGGTNAKPFTTHFNALDTDFYLRIAPELYLKRLIVGGYEKVFEIARNFRNEGIDQTHFPEFTMLEWYEAYADYHRVMDLAEALTKHLVKELTGGTILRVNDREIDIGGEWPRIEVGKLVKKYLDVEWNTVTDAEVKKLLDEHNVEIKGTWDKDKALFTLFDHTVPAKLIDPVWVIDYPQSVSPLSKSHRIKPGRAERFEGYIGGVEVFDGWSEVVSGIEQRKRFENEQRNMQEGDDEAMPLDEDFIEALEYGCPPLGGIGFGIDRLVMFLTNVWSIKKVVSFPILKPEERQDNVVKANIAEVELEKDYQSILPSREEAQKKLEEHVTDEYQLHHAKMVATVMEAYAAELGEDKDLWYITGLLHDIDYFEHPETHPAESLTWFKEWKYPEELIHAVAAHALKEPRIEPKTKLAAALIAVDELTGLLYAYSLMRPNGFEGIKASSVKKKFKDKAFAAKIDRTEIEYGMEKFGVEFADHVQFVIEQLKKL